MQPFQTVNHFDGTGGVSEEITSHLWKSFQIRYHGIEQVAKQRNESICRPGFFQKRFDIIQRTAKIGG